MADIRVLPETLSNQIAAGEVVARPASVVKELVENSIDAQSTHITVEVEKGGKRLIRVADNGDGMSRDNALLSLERYATSKIASKADLFSISSMGFRGEALPSIASVCKFSLTTRERDSAAATRIDVSGGKILTVADTGAPPGTMIEAQQLFFNTPARKKFLKTEKTEMNHIHNTFSGLALGHPGIQFRLFREKKLVNNFTRSDTLYDRCVKILGGEVDNNLIAVDYTEKFIRVNGFVSAPAVTRSTARTVWLFANNRPVSDRGLVSSILKGFQGRLMKARYPLAVIFVSLPYQKIDVNVHPSKLEVRFFDAGMVYRCVAAAVKKALENAQKEFFAPPHLKKHAPFSLTNHENRESVDALAVEEPLFDLKTPFHSTAESRTGTVAENKSGSSPGKYSVKGQVFFTYIVAESCDGMILVDQHAAHERILYEKLKNRRPLPSISQNLLVPETVELGFTETSLLESVLQDLASVGFIIEHFGQNTFAVKAVPAIIDERAAAPLVLEIVDKLAEYKNPANVNREWLDEILILMACHTAVRANQSLTLQEMETLLSDLEDCDNALHCPHGRPTMVKWEARDMEKLFKRVV